MLYRGRLAVIYDMLRVIRENRKIRPTLIMYKANLSHKLMKECLTVLLADGLILEAKNKGNSFYSITPKGQEFISDFSKIRGLTNNFRWQEKENY